MLFPEAHGWCELGGESRWPMSTLYRGISPAVFSQVLPGNSAVSKRARTHPDTEGQIGMVKVQLCGNGGNAGRRGHGLPFSLVQVIDAVRGAKASRMKATDRITCGASFLVSVALSCRVVRARSKMSTGKSRDFSRDFC